VNTDTLEVTIVVTVLDFKCIKYVGYSTNLTTVLLTSLGQ